VRWLAFLMLCAFVERTAHATAEYDYRANERASSTAGLRRTGSAGRASRSTMAYSGSRDLNAIIATPGGPNPADAVAQPFVVSGEMAVA